jgi:hypothetical protein
MLPGNRWAFLLGMKPGMGRTTPETIFSKHFENRLLRPTFEGSALTEVALKLEVTADWHCDGSGTRLTLY